MPRPPSPASDQEEGNDSQLQDELKKLKDQYRILQNDRKKTVDEAQNKLKKYNDEIDHLEKDNQDLQTVLNQAESNQNKRMDGDVLDELKELTYKHDDYSEKIEQEKQRIASLEAEIRKLEKQHRDSERKNKKRNQDEDFHAATHKRTRVMENRLDKQINIYNDTLTENAGLRDEIEKLRNERDIFNKVYKRLDDELLRLRREKDDLTEKATQAYDQRDEANNKCQALKDKNDKDRVQYDMERRDLQRVVDHDNRLREFMKFKSNERSEWKKAEEERRKQHGSAGEQARKQQTQQIETYQNAYASIKKITNEEDMHHIVTEFIKKEDENFGFFQYVSELNNQVENLSEEIEAIQEEIRKYQAEEKELEMERQKILRNLEIQLDKKKQEISKAETRLTEVNKILDQLRTGVKSVFDKIGCEDEVILEMLGSDSDVSDRNVMLFMGSVEQRINELLLILYYVQTKKFKSDSERTDGDESTEAPEPGMTLGISSTSDVHRESSIVPPGIGDDFEDSAESADELRPLSQNELKNKVYKDIKKRENRAPRGQGKTYESKKQTRKA